MDATEKWNVPFAEEWLGQIRDAERCKWCGEGDKPINRARFCAACKRTQRYAATVRKETGALPDTATDHERWKQNRELQVAEMMEELCKADGEQLSTILHGDLYDAANLERLFNRAAYAICQQREFYGHNATQLGMTFSSDQRRILAYLLWTATLADHKRRRMKLAIRRLHRLNLRREEREAGSDAI
jgi:hypothetical protein